MIKYLNIFSVLLIIGCSAKHTPISQNGEFVEYVNDNKISMKLDASVVKDKEFKLLIPVGLQNRHLIVEDVFLQTLDYKNDQKIILLYIPGAKESPNLKLTDISYIDFIRTCQRKDIGWHFKDVVLNTHRRFGIYKPNSTGFYVIYLNIRTNQVNTFNYSIKSIQLK
jgi:hypothetical protein